MPTNFITKLWGRARALLKQSSPKQVDGRDLWVDVRRRLGRHNAPLCVDVGAFQGSFFTRFLRAFPGGRVIAFEPAFEEGLELKRAFGHDSRVTVETLALGNVPGSMALIRFAHPNLNSLLPMANTPSNPFRGEKVEGTELVQVTTLDAYCHDRAIDWIDLLKVDTQGFDLQVLRGATSLLEGGQVGLLLVELNFATLYAGQARAGRVLDFLCACGYFPLQLYNVRRIPYIPGEGARSRAWYAQKALPYPDGESWPISWCDMLFCRHDGAER